MNLNLQLDVLKDYIKMCLAKEDWHGVRDAATDIEVLKARIEERDNSAACGGLGYVDAEEGFRHPGSDTRMS